MHTSTSRKGLVGLGLVLSIGLIISAYLLTSTAHHFNHNFPKIVVKGYAEKQITSDYGIWNVNFYARANTLQEAFQKIERDRQLILQYLKQKEISDEEVQIIADKIRTYNKRIGKDHEFETNEVESYLLTSSFSVRSHHISRLAAISSDITSLLKEGVEINSLSPEYVFTKIDSLKIEMLGEAARDAYARATQISSEGKSKVGKLKMAQQGVFQITPAFSTSVSDYGENDTTSIIKSIKAIVTMEYEIK